MVNLFVETTMAFELISSDLSIARDPWSVSPYVARGHYNDHVTNEQIARDLWSLRTRD